MKKDLTFDDWKKIGNLGKDVSISVANFTKELSKAFNKGDYKKYCGEAKILEEKLFDLKWRLEEIAKTKFPKIDDVEINSIFFGEIEK